MNVADFLRIVGDDQRVVYEGSLNVEFEGFQLPGIKEFNKNRFQVLMDRSWSKKQRSWSPQHRRPLDETLKVFESLGVTNIVAPMELWGSSGLRGYNVLYVEGGSYDFLNSAGLRAREAASAAGIPIIGVTGAAGKSTLSAMISHAYETVVSESSVLHPPPNFNLLNRAMSELTRVLDYDAVVLELSQVVFRRLKSLKETISPDIAVITNISHAHTEWMGSLEEVAKLKSEILNKPRDGSAAVINMDTAYAEFLADKAKAEGWNLVLFGEGAGADFRLISYCPESQKVRARTPLGEMDYSISHHGRHMALNSVATLAVLYGVGVRELDSVAQSFQSFAALKGRGQVFSLDTGSGAITLIDEAYNAIPASMRAAIESLDGMQAGGYSGRRVAVLGDMLELGDSAKEHHQKLYRLLVESSIDRFYLYGDLMGEVFAEAKNDHRFVHFGSQLQLINYVKEDIRAGDVMVIKSSHGTGLHHVVTALRETWSESSK